MGTRGTFARGAGLAGAIIALQMVSTAPAAAQEAATPAEAAAMRVRVVQTEMMVAALTCDLHAQYNTVIEVHGSELKSHAAVLKSMFRRLHGGAAQPRLDSYVTELANDASMRSIRARRSFCEAAGEMFKTALDDGMTLTEVSGRLEQQAALPTP